MDFSSLPASGYPLPELVRFLNEGFEAYAVPIQFNTVTFLNLLRKDGIDLTASRVLTVDGRPGGIALIARRGWVSRLAAMGIAEAIRGMGAGSWLMDSLIQEARQRGERQMALEVIEQNEPAVRLYQKHGFRQVRRLVGFVRVAGEQRGTGGPQGMSLQEIDLREMGRLVSVYGLTDLPWQLSGESIAQLNPPARAYQGRQAYIAISNPEVEQVVIWSLLVEPGSRRKGLGLQMLRSILAEHPGKIWHMPALLPEECGKVFERAGFDREDLSQWQMVLSL